MLQLVPLGLAILIELNHESFVPTNVILLEKYIQQCVNEIKNKSKLKFL